MGIQLKHPQSAEFKTDCCSLEIRRNGLYAENGSAVAIHGSSRANAALMIKPNKINQKCALYPRKSGIMA
jgi:hypothetical protein